MTRIFSPCVLSLLACAPALASDPYINVPQRYPYPEFDYCFQDKRSIHDILAMRLPPRLSLAGDPDSPGAPQFCFAPGTPLKVIAEVEASMRAANGPAFNQGDQAWTGGGNPVALTWSFAPDNIMVGYDGDRGGVAPNQLFARMDALFGNNRALWISKIQACFDRWSALTGVTYTRVTDGANDWDDGAAWGSVSGPTRGDIRISMKPIDGVSNVLAYNYYPPNGDMVLDRWESWNSFANDYRFLRNIVCHEHGHGLGLAHTCPQNNSKLMEPNFSAAYDGPQQDDIRGAQSFYGDPFEPNDSASTATVVGALTPGVDVNLGAVPNPAPSNAALLSIDSGVDTDWFQFSLDQPRLINVTLTPIGTTYPDAPQGSNGSCADDGTPVNALASSNLAFDVRSASGTIVYRSVNAAAAGIAESTSGLLCGPAGNFFVRVYSGGSHLDIQSYKLTVTAQTTPLAPSASDGAFTNKVRITWPNSIPDATGFQIARNTVNSTQTATNIGTVGGTVLQYDDYTAAPSVTYYYWVRAQQPGSTGYRFTTTSGEPGFRAGVNQPPVANAGPDQFLVDSDNSGTETVILDASLSSDPDGVIANYLWQEASTVLASSSNPVSIVGLSVGVHTITLTVTDSGGATGVDTVVVTVDPPRVNQPPVADAGPDQLVVDSDFSGAPMIWLDGRASRDQDGVITSYVWREGDSVIASGPTPAVTLTIGVHRVTLTVTDDANASASDSVNITVIPGNHPPLADAGSDQLLTDFDRSGDEPVQLDGSSSSDAEGPIAAYRWTEGESFLADGSAPVVLLPLGDHAITLTVTDSAGAASSDTMMVSIITPCAADYNADGGIDGGDVEMFFADWEAGSSASDVNSDGGIDGGDVEYFFAVWENGGC